MPHSRALYSCSPGSGLQDRTESWRATRRTTLRGLGSSWGIRSLDTPGTQNQTGPPSPPAALGTTQHLLHGSLSVVGSEAAETNSPVSGFS